ncbi:MAG: DUF3300 domain-containing protein, partial [Gammaproteobacteria bacterium]|nr:DUF3300 domain-containing protein [Gammaproteobacteria bacterium]
AALLTGGGAALCAPDEGADTPALASAGAAVPAASAAAMEPAALEELLAPIALYPDALLGAMFAAASHSQEVMDAGNWRLENSSLAGPALDAAAAKAGFGPGTRALLAFPTVLDMMCKNFDWTQQLGAAFNADQGALMAAAQRLRAQAVAVGNLASGTEQQVEQRTVNEQRVVEITPTNPTQVYVPQYNPEAVYTQPAPAPVQYIAVPGAVDVTQVVAGPSTGDLIAAGVIGFTAAVIIANIFNQNRYPPDYYHYYPYPYPRWGYGFFYYDNRPWYARGYRYRPNYGYGGYRPGYHGGRRYHPPANYPHVWNQPGAWHQPPPGYRSSLMVTVNTTQVTYFNRFGNNQNLSGGGKPRPALVAAPVRERVNAQYRPASRPLPAAPVAPPGGQGRPTRDNFAPVPGRPDKPVYQPATPPREVPKITERDVKNRLPPASVEPTAPPRPQAQPATRPQAQPATRPQAQPATRPQAQPATRQQDQPATRPQAQPATRPQDQPATRREAKPATRPQDQPATRREAKPATRPEPKKDHATSTQAAPKAAKSTKNQLQ